MRFKLEKISEHTWELTVNAIGLIVKGTLDECTEAIQSIITNVTSY